MIYIPIFPGKVSSQIYIQSAKGFSTALLLLIFMPKVKWRFYFESVVSVVNFQHDSISFLNIFFLFLLNHIVKSLFHHVL